MRPRKLRAPAVLVPLVALATLLSPAEPSADEDGGVVSVFSQGAGTRALSLGGAFAAVADGAGAWTWNPGGLGFITQSQLEATQMSQDALDLSEHYLGFVLPSWRWGALSATYRQLGVTGIEGRDSRNQVVSDDLADRESEFAIGYGHAPAETWSVGGVAKVRRQELAGRSGTGIGADVGVLMRPAAWLGLRSDRAREITVGLAVRNLLEPSLRLDLEEVPDPRALRVGLAYRHTFWGGRSLLAALDLDRTDGRDARMCAGVEWNLHPAFDLRAGLDAGNVTAGTGVRYRNLGIDYAYDNGELETLHRVGLSMRFGSTVSESRTQSLQAREQEIERRLAEVFQQRRTARIEELLTKAKEARARGQCDEALDALATLQAIEPEHQGGTQLELDCLHDKATAAESAGDLAGAALLFAQLVARSPADSAAVQGLARSRAASDLRAARTAEIRRKFAAALDAFSADDLPAARRGFQAILANNPSDQEARAMLARVERAADRRAGALFRQAERALQTGALDAVPSLLEQARALDPQAPELERLSAALARAREAAAAAQAPRKPVTPARGALPGLTAAEQREVAELYQKGLSAMERGRTEEAIQYWELVWSKQPRHANVAAVLKREYTTRGLESFASGRLDEAVSLWERALRIDPDDERTRAYLSRAQERLARAVEMRRP